MWATTIKPLLSGSTISHRLFLQMTPIPCRYFIQSANVFLFVCKHRTFERKHTKKAMEKTKNYKKKKNKQKEISVNKINFKS